MSYLTRPLLFRYLNVRYDMLSVSEGHLTAALEGRKSAARRRERPEVR